MINEMERELQEKDEDSPWQSKTLAELQRRFPHLQTFRGTQSISPVLAASLSSRVARLHLCDWLAPNQGNQPALLPLLRKSTALRCLVINLVKISGQTLSVELASEEATLLPELTRLIISGVWETMALLTRLACPEVLRCLNLRSMPTFEDGIHQELEAFLPSASGLETLLCSDWLIRTSLPPIPSLRQLTLDYFEEQPLPDLDATIPGLVALRLIMLSYDGQSDQGAVLEDQTGMQSLESFAMRNSFMKRMNIARLATSLNRWPLLRRLRLDYVRLSDINHPPGLRLLHRLRILKLAVNLDEVMPETPAELQLPDELERLVLSCASDEGNNGQIKQVT